MSEPNVTVLTVVPLEKEETKKEDNLVPVLEKSVVLVQELLHLAESLKTAVESKYGSTLEQARLTRKSATSDCVCPSSKVEKEETFKNSVMASCSATVQVPSTRAIRQQVASQTCPPCTPKTQEILTQTCPPCPPKKQETVTQTCPPCPPKKQEVVQKTCPPCPKKESPKEEPLPPCCYCSVNNEGSKDGAEERCDKKSAAGEGEPVETKTKTESVGEAKDKQLVPVEVAQEEKPESKVEGETAEQAEPQAPQEEKPSEKSATAEDEAAEQSEPKTEPDLEEKGSKKLEGTAEEEKKSEPAAEDIAPVETAPEGAEAIPEDTTPTDLDKTSPP